MARVDELMRQKNKHSGFTLIEMVIVIVITGIVAAMVTVFMKGPIEAYIAGGRRAELTDIADTTLRRMSRELRLAVPRTVRVTNVGSVYFVEFLMSKAGGRYVQDDNCFTATGCTSLTIQNSNGTIASGDSLVINNRSSNSGTDTCSTELPSAYCTGQNKASLTGVTTTVLSFASTTFYPSGGSESRRFQVSDGPVTFRCDPVTGQLTRHSGYAISATQPTPAAAGGALLAGKVSACSFDYTAQVFERWGVLGMRLDLTDASSGESIALYQEVHIDNLP